MQKTTKNLIIIGGVTLAPLVLAMNVAFAHEPPTGEQGHYFDNHAYVVDSQGHLVRDSQFHCVRTGSWTEEHALVECGDAVAVAPAPAPGPDPVAIEPFTLQAEALFDFDKSVLRPEGREILNEFADKLKAHPEVEVVMATGHTDRLGSTAYNQRLSERRVAAVKRYLVDNGIESSRIETAARGESDPEVACDDIGGAENRRNKPLIECLQPNRRVEVEVTVQAEQPR